MNVDYYRFSEIVDEKPGHYADLPMPNHIYLSKYLKGILIDQDIYWYIGDEKEHLLATDLHCDSYFKIIFVWSVRSITKVKIMISYNCS